jgi:LPPG:FO 2-phospho-L-lactate transferase
MIVALAGGVGGARLAVGLADRLSPRELAIVVNTGDDFEHLGLVICPDLDTVTYTLAGIHNPKTGWGRAAETWSCMQTLGTLGAATWFNLGDRDLGLHLARTAALRRGKPLSAVTHEVTRSFGLRHAILPMSDSPVRTLVKTRAGMLAFQDYFVRLRCKPRVEGFRFLGAQRARVPSRLQALIGSQRVRAVVICPSNPYVSVAPILAIAKIRRWLGARSFPVVAVSPIIGGAAVKGPAAKMMRELGAEASALGIARHYGDVVDGWIIDRTDELLAPGIEALGARVMATDTLMRKRAGSQRLAGEVIAFAHALRAARAR